MKEWVGVVIDIVLLCVARFLNMYLYLCVCGLDGLGLGAYTLVEDAGLGMMVRGRGSQSKRRDRTERTNEGGAYSVVRMLDQ